MLSIGLNRMEWTGVLFNVIQTIAIAMIIWYWQKRQSKRDVEYRKQEEARRQEFMLSMEMNLASAKLTKAVAIAYKRGRLNGELDEGLEAFEVAKGNYLKFLNAQAGEYLAK